MSNLDAALAYAKKGWAVIPLCGKIPAISKADDGRGVHDATTNCDTIQQWWTKDPNANIGIACGQEFWVLDIDGDEGEDSLAEMQKEHGPLPETVEQITGNGRHLLFKFNGENVQNSVKFKPGLDTRSGGGYIVAAPSYHQGSGRRYEWEVDHHPDDVEVMAAPDWLVELIVDKPPVDGEAADPFIAFGRSTPKSPSYGKAALDAEAVAIRSAPIGSQENILNSAALKIGQLIGSGALDFDQARETLIAAGLDMANDPQKKTWNASEITAKVERGLRDGMAKPRQAKAGTAADAPHQRTLRLLRWRELGNLPTREPLVKGVLDRGAMSVSYGPTNCGKSFMALDLAARVSLGWEWFGHKVKQGSVIYIAAEGGLGIAERLTAFQLRHEIQPDAPLYVLPTVIDLCKTRKPAAELLNEISRLTEPELIVIDTLSRAMAGGNENSPDDLGAFVANCDTLRQGSGAHVMIIHHTGKDESRGSRGHSLLAAAADTLIEVSKNELSGVVTATIVKQRDRATGDTFSFKLDPVEIGMDEDEEYVTSCVVEPTDAPSETPRDVKRNRLSDSQKVALDQLHRAIGDVGKTPAASNHIPGNRRAVTMTMFRTYCVDGGVSASDEDDSQRKAFKRAADRLLALGLIGKWQEYVWLT
jgi:hypothetical protein